MPDLPLLDPKLDFIFKKLFTEHDALLLDLINAVRSEELPVIALKIKNPQIAANELKGKHIVLDIWAQDAQGQQFDIEMQTNKHAGWNARSVYYLARALGEQLGAGLGYDHIQPVVGIHLLDFDLFPEPNQAIWEFELRDRQRPDVVLDRCLQLNVIELPKADRRHSRISPVLAQWVTYFKHASEESVMQQIQHPPIQEAYQHLRALSGDEHVRHAAFVRERALRDAITNRHMALAEGRAEGRAEGKVEGIAIGERRGQAHVLARQLRTKFGALPHAIEQQIQRASSEQLEHWAEQILFAQRLEQVINFPAASGGECDSK